MHPIKRRSKDMLPVTSCFKGQKIFILFLLLYFSFKEVMEQHKATNLVPAAQTKERLHRSLSSHSEAKLESIDISLFCPLTHSRMVTPVRGQYCNHIHCFDGEAFCNLMWQKPSPKWKCPVSFFFV